LIVDGASGDLARFCVVGLGNPGEEYRGTRHNVGFEVVDVLAARAETVIRRPEYRALTAAVRICRSMVIVMKPQEYMNRSGRSVADALGALGLTASGLVVVYDDLDLPLGRFGCASAAARAGTEESLRSSNRPVRTLSCVSASEWGGRRQVYRRWTSSCRRLQPSRRP